MALAHISDEQIQGYLDGNPTGREKVAKHLVSCPVCREAVKEYRLLWATLADDHGFELPQEFAAAVAARVVQPAKASRHSWLVDLSLVIVPVAACLVTASLFIDFSHLWAGVKQFLAANFGSNVAALSATKAFLAQFGIKSSLLASAAATMLLIAVADRLFATLRRGTNTPLVL